MKDEYIRERWGQYFSWLMNEENPRMETEDRAPNQGMTSPVSEAETDRALGEMKCGKAERRDTSGGMEMPGTVGSGDTLLTFQQNHDHWVHTIGLAKQNSGPHFQRKG